MKDLIDCYTDCPLSALCDAGWNDVFSAIRMPLIALSIYTSRHWLGRYALAFEGAGFRGCRGQRW